ncbi:DUF2971 family protein [Buttiauxella sp. BIGb0552]|jgi:hypothetical protein|uniref:DUF2971 domain-containing protein n=1 Tax=Buttiauxella sp. BIGb0552 TaxID=2485120 RepID=UPI00106682CE|nr:DUF2971 domain-containing protein [Buttiauxella sp. BIGb0552]TDX12031.1 DUF2971 family protein [Buttiauxella sp. BIGb0552]
MYLFKYYRPDFFFDKAIRYNELYFSSHEQLNDPNDLKTSYFFEDEIHMWQRLLESEFIAGVRELQDVLDLTDRSLAKELCRIFHGTPMDGSIEQLECTFLKYDDAIVASLGRHLKSSESIKSTPFKDSSESRSELILLCKNGIRDRVLKGIRAGVYSVSFSTRALEPMMWAHYAAGFKGCVVIYNALNNEINLTRNIYSKEYFPFIVDNVEYEDCEKHIPILQSALGDDKSIRNILLVKNKFWKYEAEKRIFHTRTYIATKVWKLSFLLSKDHSDRIFHHDPSLIAGIIFGPGFSGEKKESIEFLLRDNRRHSPCEPFYLFDTELTSKGAIQIVRGKEVESSFQTGNTGEISRKELAAVLSKLGIT